ncbi:hypothetical protein ANCDUO_00140 [Ancylostoma duodenale]|uniref:Uncharacterized protein n=1 Tax=Ancylostoma duodenale TaxID=51022 RepID=A0A0C2HIV1_9BILA|nr:hypothetical protein ANCDUO_00140 [Ancylostoma duodenale]
MVRLLHEVLQGKIYNALRVPRADRIHWTTLARERDKWKEAGLLAPARYIRRSTGVKVQRRRVDEIRAAGDFPLQLRIGQNVHTPSYCFMQP